MARGLTLDAGVLVAAERNERSVWLLNRLRLQRGVGWSVPTPVLAQAWRGPSSARLAQLLATCDVVDLDERLAKAAGVLCGAAGTSDIADASVVATARARGEFVLTTDVEDLTRLASFVGDVRVLDLRLL